MKKLTEQEIEKLALDNLEYYSDDDKNRCSKQIKESFIEGFQSCQELNEKESDVYTDGELLQILLSEDMNDVRITKINQLFKQSKK